MDRVCAVIVTYNRKELLRECLRAVLSQTRPPDHVLVVDNASTDGTPEMLREEFPQVEVLRLPENQGGAGGFHEGMKRAYEAGFEWLWVMDDDAIPRKTCLEKLLISAKESKFKVIGPLVVDVKNPADLAFPLMVGRRMLLKVSEVQPSCINGYINLWNGAVLHKSVIDKVGLPNKELFVRGEEVDYHFRLKRSGVRFATVKECEVLHPGSSNEQKPLLGRRLVVVSTGNRIKDFYFYRNRGYLLRTYYRGVSFGLYVLLEFLRYSYFFLVIRRNVDDWKAWRRAFLLGLKGELKRHE